MEDNMDANSNQEEEGDRLGHAEDNNDDDDDEGSMPAKEATAKTIQQGNRGCCASSGGCACTCTCACICRWLLGVISNTLMIALLIWCDVHGHWWHLGCPLSFLYSVMLWLVVLPYCERERQANIMAAAVNDTNSHAFRKNARSQGCHNDEEEPEETETRPNRSNDTSKASVAPKTRTKTAASREYDYSAGHSLWYLLAILSIGAPQAYIIFHVFPCRYRHYKGSSQIPYISIQAPLTWETDYDALPSDDVRLWYDKTNHFRGFSPSQTCRLPMSNGTDVTYLSGIPSLGDIIFDPKHADGETSNIYHPVLMVYLGNETHPRSLVRYNDPESTTPINANQICFVSVIVDATTIGDRYLVCGEYDAFNETRIVGGKLIGLTTIDDMVWFKQRLPNDYADQSLVKQDKYEYDLVNAMYPQGLDGFAVVSMDVNTKETKVWSQLTNGTTVIGPWQDPNGGRALDAANKGSDGDSDGDQRYLKSAFGEQSCKYDGGISRWRVTTSLFTIAVPITVLSAYLWIKKAVPTTSITLYFGMMLNFMCLEALVNPWSTGVQGMLIWSVLGSAIWLYTSAFQLTVDTKVVKAPFCWGLYSVSLWMVLSAGVTLLVTFIDMSWYSYGGREIEGEEIVLWIMTSCLVFVPIAAIGCMSNNCLIFCLGMLGLMLEGTVVILRVARNLSKPLQGFLVLVVILAFGAIGVLIRYKWDTIRGRIVDWLNRCAAHACSVELLDEEELDEGEVTGLLLDEEAELT